MKNGNVTDEEPKTMYDVVLQGLKDNQQQLLDMKSNKKNGFVTIKAPGTITRPTNITGPDADRLPQPQYVPGLKLIPERNPFITEFLDVASTSSSVWKMLLYGLLAASIILNGFFLFRNWKQKTLDNFSE